MPDNRRELPLAARLGASIDGVQLADGSSYVAIKPSLLAPTSVRATVELEHFPDTHFDVRLRWDSETLGYRVEHLGITTDRGISTSDLHAYSVPTLVRVVASSGVLVELESITGEAGKFTGFEEFLALVDLDAMRTRASTGPADSLWLVAILYAYARTVGLNPNRTVVDLLALPQRTATRWIARARTEGLLD
ncbi:hypothetical protein [Agromyces albus]|uniref:hypothetical protein n=1 Tax=Agromyces albus TaxID=205332 RepID=UPI002784FE62|nr:hypothetical protein [Agromyces albus]MDQ0576474.1 hypothetical protein [Agromyces albus]